MQFDSEKQAWRARAPELEHCQAEGATRAEALARLEEEIDAQVRNMREHGGQPPRPVDEQDFSGEIVARVSKSLHRELEFQARIEGIELGQLVGELLAAGLEARRASRSGAKRPPVGEESEGNAWAGRDRQRAGMGGRYHGIMEDRANFIEYVRGLDQGAGPPPSGPRHGRRRGGGPRRP